VLRFLLLAATVALTTTQTALLSRSDYINRRESQSDWNMLLLPEATSVSSGLVDLFSVEDVSAALSRVADVYFNQLAQPNATTIDLWFPETGSDGAPAPAQLEWSVFDHVADSLDASASFFSFAQPVLNASDLGPFAAGEEAALASVFQRLREAHLRFRVRHFTFTYRRFCTLWSVDFALDGSTRGKLTAHVGLESTVCTHQGTRHVSTVAAIFICLLVLALLQAVIALLPLTELACSYAVELMRQRRVSIRLGPINSPFNAPGDDSVASPSRSASDDSEDRRAGSASGSEDALLPHPRPRFGTGGPEPTLSNLLPSKARLDRLDTIPSLIPQRLDSSLGASQSSVEEEEEAEAGEDEEDDDDDEEEEEEDARRRARKPGQRAPSGGDLEDAGAASGARRKRRPRLSRLTRRALQHAWALVDVWLVVALLCCFALMYSSWGSLLTRFGSRNYITDLGFSFWFGLGCMLSWVQLLPWVQRLGPPYTSLVMTLHYASPFVARVVMGFFPVFMGFALSAQLLFFVHTPAFSDLGQTFVTLFSLMNGDFVLQSFTELSRAYPVIGQVFVYAFVLIFITVVSKMILAGVEYFFFQSVPVDHAEIPRDAKQRGPAAPASASANAAAATPPRAPARPAAAASQPRPRQPLVPPERKHASADTLVEAALQCERAFAAACAQQALSSARMVMEEEGSGHSNSARRLAEALAAAEHPQSAPRRLVHFGAASQDRAALEDALRAARERPPRRDESRLLAALADAYAREHARLAEALRRVVADASG
jgi:hypothetical protein